MSLLSIGVSGLNAAQAGLSSTSHNINNVNTPGFSRQNTVQATNLPQFTGAGYIGQGVNVSTVARAYNGFLDIQAREAQTQSSHLDSLHTRLSDIDRLLSDAQSGLSPALDNFFATVGTVAANPSDSAARQTLVSSSEVAASRFRGIAGRLADLREGVNVQVANSVSAINSASAQIARLNERIAQASAAGNAPNDLLDTRDSLLRDLAKEIRVSVVEVAGGGINVFLGSGQPLVLELRSFDLQAQSDPANPQDLAVGVAAGGTFQAFRDASLTGGALGGALAFRSEGLDVAQNSLGRMALAFAGAINARHATGMDRNGAFGGAMFAASAPQAIANDNNVGNAALGAAIADVNALTTSDYRLGYDGSNYTLTRLSDQTQQIFSSLPQTFDGVAITLATGAPVAGDSFLIQPTRAGALNLSALVSDPNKLAAAFPVRAAIANTNGGSAALRVTGVVPPPGPDISQPVTITFTSATTFNVSGTGTGNPTGLTYTPGMTLSYNGWSAQLNGVAAAGDGFSVVPNAGGTGDNGNILAIASLRTAKLLGQGTTSLSDAYAQVVADVGNRTRSAEIGSQAQAAVLTQAFSAQQAVSGVNLDEEAANLLMYQQAYQAAGKVIATANALFDEILRLAR